MRTAASLPLEESEDIIIANLKRKVRTLKESMSSNALSERKISALLKSVYRAPNEKSGLENVVSYRISPKSAFGGDFFWARRIPSGAAIVVGDATGHDAYAALLNVIVGIILRSISRGRGRKIRSAAWLARELVRRFLTIMKRAETAFTENAPPMGPKYSMKGDGFDMVCIVIMENKIEVCSAGLPLYLVNQKGKIASIGDFNPTKTINSSMRIGSLKGMLHERKRRGLHYLIACSDGIIAQQNESGHHFTERALRTTIQGVVSENGCSGKDIADRIIRANEEHRSAAEISDDRVVLVVDLQELT